MAAIRRLLKLRNLAVSNNRSVLDAYQQMVTNIRNGIFQLRQLSRLSGYQFANRELGKVDKNYHPSFHDFAQFALIDIVESRKFAINFASLWLKHAKGDSFVESARAANKASYHRLELIAVTESSKAYNSGKSLSGRDYDGSLNLYKVWDAGLDKSTCHACSSNDGEIVSISENFSFGEPGAVHPNCRCTYSIFTEEEVAHWQNNKL